MMNETCKENSIIKTFFSYTVPCIIGLFLTSFIIVVDGIFIGWKVGERGLAAVNLTLPVLYLLMAITFLIGVGGVTLAAQSLGAKQNDKASYYFSFSLTVIAIVDTVLVMVVALFPDAVITLLGAHGIVHQYVKDFLGVLVYFYLFMMMNMAFSMFIRAEGKPQVSLMFGLVGNFLNILLDYLFIIRLEWGMSGAALASGISVLLPFLFGLGYFLTHRSVYRFCPFNATLSELKYIIMNGTAEFIAQISVSITTFAFNMVLLERVGVNGVAALTVIGYVFFVHNMIVTGIAVGIHPLLSFHFGAKKVRVISELLSTAVKAVILAGAAVSVVAFFGAPRIMSTFAGDNDELISIGTTGLRWFSLAFILNGYNIIITAFFTSLGEAKKAACVSSLRSLILVVAFLMILPRIFGNTGIWLTAPLAEGIAFFVAYFFVKNSNEKLAYLQKNELISGTDAG